MPDLHPYPADDHPGPPVVVAIVLISVVLAACIAGGWVIGSMSGHCAPVEIVE